MTLGIVAPDGREGMLQHAREFAEAGIPFLFDPGQGMPMFNGEELLEFLRMAQLRRSQRLRGAAAAGAHRRRHRSSSPRRVKALIVTRGAEGSLIYADGRQLRIPGVQADQPWSIPPAAAMPIAPGCSTASRRAATGRPPGGSPRSWARSRSRSRGGQNHRRHARRDRRTLPRGFRSFYLVSVHGGQET